MNGQIQDDDQESKENHEGRRTEKRDLKIPRKRKKVKMMVSDLLERVEEKDQTRRDKEFCIVHFQRELEREKRENLQQHQRLSEVEEEKENLSEEVRYLVRVLNEKDQDLSLANEELEKQRASVSRLQNEIEKEREANLLLPVLHSDLRRLQSELQALQANLGEEQQARQRLEEELHQPKRTCVESEGGLENGQLLSQSNQQAAQTKEETRKEQMRQLEQDPELKLCLEERARGLQTEVDEGRIRKVSIGKFDCLEPRHCEDIKGIEGPKCFGTFEKQAPEIGRASCRERE